MVGKSLSYHPFVIRDSVGQAPTKNWLNPLDPGNSQPLAELANFLSLVANIQISYTRIKSTVHVCQIARTILIYWYARIIYRIWSTSTYAYFLAPNYTSHYYIYMPPKQTLYNDIQMISNVSPPLCLELLYQGFRTALELGRIGRRSWHAKIDVRYIDLKYKWTSNKTTTKQCQFNKPSIDFPGFIQKKHENRSCGIKEIIRSACVISNKRLTSSTCTQKLASSGMSKRTRELLVLAEKTKRGPPEPVADASHSSQMFPATHSIVSKAWSQDTGIHAILHEMCVLRPCSIQ